MSTYADMRNRIIEETMNAANASHVNNCILTAIEFYARRPFYFNTKTATFSTVASQANYAAAALADIPDIVDIRSMTITISGQKVPLKSATFEDIDAVDDGSSTGDPTNYAYFAQQIRLWPIPSGVRTITASYVYKLAELSADTDENAWTNDAEELIRQSAKKRWALDYDHDEALGMRCAMLEKDALEVLIQETKRKKARPELVVALPFGGNNAYNINTD